MSTPRTDAAPEKADSGKPDSVNDMTATGVSLDSGLKEHFDLDGELRRIQRFFEYQRDTFAPGPISQQNQHDATIIGIARKELRERLPVSVPVPVQDIASGFNMFSTPKQP